MTCAPGASAWIGRKAYQFSVSPSEAWWICSGAETFHRGFTIVEPCAKAGMYKATWSWFRGLPHM